ncbi:hypothetical protein LMG3458_05744 [Achromobacter deleyi]|uniref:Lipoprotein n=1 Tax=Achromobacter deleyi TaxID=1353891 RepID=A0A6S7AX37_9BURK|nr:hypothetical protein [Achromobacter deleyi]CAB3740638.1 hypothetical protein LMG3458_05744 [Achromobacter deleyi]CAB3925169.1 hypothetical protein LMG3482_05801 [Achromobacter deleyi]CAB3927862.1 hypothetical protein LMG3481_06116 [Achromobacter deleyi]CAB3928337.1 hypothetical protein LMG3412_06166 [Achromobacter deleyi]
MAFVFLRRALAGKWRLGMLGVVALLAGCAGGEPRIGDSYTVHTPIYADNRIFYLKPAANPAESVRTLELAGTPVSANEQSTVVQANAPLSIMMRSVDIPAIRDANGNKTVGIDGPADYAVILDIAAKEDGSNQSIVVWYQRGVQPDQSLNFSNLLVYYVQRWDERVAPSFRLRVMDVTTERNAETLRALQRAQGVASGAASLANNPLVSPLVGVAFTAAELVLANQRNRMVLDYSVQLYSQAAVNQAAGSDLGLLKQGTYVVVGRPVGGPRAFWEKPLRYNIRTNQALDGDKPLNVPTALVSVGTFESIVPKSVLEKSVALTALLSKVGTGASIEQVSDAQSRLEAALTAYTLGERLARYRDDKTLNLISDKLNDEFFANALGSEEEFLLLRGLNACYKPKAQFTRVEEFLKFHDKPEGKACAART